MYFFDFLLSFSDLKNHILAGNFILLTNRCTQKFIFTSRDKKYFTPVTRLTKLLCSLGMTNDRNIPPAKWELLQSPDETDFYRCFELCYDDLYRLGLYLYKDAELVKESIQLLFIELWKIKDRLADVRNIKEYVLTIFKRILYKQKTGSEKHWSKLEMIDDAGTDQLHTDSYEEILIQHQEATNMQKKLLQVLPLLAERQRELIRLRYFEEKSIEEIAAITSLTARTIYNTLHNALSRLREMMT